MTINKINYSHDRIDVFGLKKFMGLVELAKYPFRVNNPS
jgi:hypothetical protein